MAVIVLKRPRRYIGLRECQRCHHLWVWEDVVRHPEHPRSGRILLCMQCVQAWGVIYHHTLAWQSVFGRDNVPVELT